jgi:hypothetical protein
VTGEHKYAKTAGPSLLLAHMENHKNMADISGVTAWQ